MPPAAAVPVSAWRRRDSQPTTTVDADRDHQCGKRRPPARGADRDRKVEAALRQKEAFDRYQRLPVRRQQKSDRRVPEDQMQQHRDVAHEADVGAEHLAYQPVLRQQQDADGNAEQRGQHDADHGNLQGIEEADQQRAAVAGGRRVGNRRFTDGEPRLLLEEAPAGGDLAGFEVGDGIEDQPGETGGDQREGQDLQEHIAVATVLEDQQRCRRGDCKQRQPEHQQAGYARRRNSPRLSARREYAMRGGRVGDAEGQACPVKLGHTRPDLDIRHHSPSPEVHSLRTQGLANGARP